MSLLCFFGRHVPSPVSLRRKGGLVLAHCDACALPLVQNERGRWVPAEPLAGKPLA
jgi:hypothetical protein